MLREPKMVVQETTFNKNGGFIMAYELYSTTLPGYACLGTDPVFFLSLDFLDILLFKEKANHFIYNTSHVPYSY